LMWEIAVSPKIKDREYKKLLIHYEMLKDNIGEAAKNNQSSIFLNPQSIDTVPHADDNRIEPCRVQQQRGSRDHQYQ